MANNERLERWISTNADILGLTVTKLGWTRNWIPGWTDIRASIVVDGQRYYGSGFDSDSDVALIKAISEACERAICAFNKIRSNGVAIHTDREMAKLNARLELVERDRLLCHHLTDSPGREMKWPGNARLAFKKINERLMASQVLVRIFELRPTLETSTIICVSTHIANPPLFGYFMGSSCSKIQERAVEHALVECLINTVCWITGQEPAVEERFQARGFANKLFVEKMYVPDMEKECFKLDDIPCEELQIPATLQGLPAFACRAYSDELQSFYEWNQHAAVNFKRLLKFSGCQDIKISHLPPPIG